MPRTSGCLSARHSLAATANMIASQLLDQPGWFNSAGSGDAGLRIPVVPTHIEKSKEVS